MTHTPSRRGLLASLGTGLTTLFAGCSTSDSRSPTDDRRSRISEYTVEFTRSTGDRPPVVALHDRDDDEENDDQVTSTPDRHISHSIGSESDAAELEFVEEATNLDAVRRLLTEATYDEESVFVFQTEIQECYQLKLSGVRRDADGDPDFQFCRVIRDAHTACELEGRDYVAAFVRLPLPGGFGAYSIGVGSSCRPARPPEPNGSESS